MTVEILILLVVYQIKHFVADYPLQTPYMLRKFLPGREFFWPLAAHAGVHAGLTLVITMLFNLWRATHGTYFGPTLGISVCVIYAQCALLALLDFLVHFGMDRIKAGPKYLGRFKALSGSEMMAIKANMENFSEQKVLVADAQNRLRGNKYFWWSLGLDQGVHHLTHYAIIWLLVS